MFAPDGTPPGELPTPFDETVQRTQERHDSLYGECDCTCWPPPRPLSIDAVRLTRPVKVAVGVKDKEVRAFAAGTLFAPDDPLVAAARAAADGGDWFEAAEVEGAVA
jgi:hypothetical protein